MHRILYDKINKLLTYFPAVVILGARQCGKTTLAKMLRPHWHYIDLDNPADFEQFQIQDPVFYLNHYHGDLIIDEAQAYPAVFDYNIQIEASQIYSLFHRPITIP